MKLKELLEEKGKKVYILMEQGITRSIPDKPIFASFKHIDIEDPDLKEKMRVDKTYKVYELEVE